MMRGNAIQAFALVRPWLHRIMQKAFASVVSFHFRFVYKVTLLRRLVELHLHSRGFCPAIALEWFSF